MPELLPSEQLPFEIDDRIDPRLVTAQVVNAQVRLKQRQRGLTSANWWRR